MTEELHRDHALVGRQIELDVVDETREVSHDQDDFIAETADKYQHLAVIRQKKLNASPSKGLVVLPEQHQPLHPPKQRSRVLLVSIDVDGLVMMFRIDNHRQVKALRIGARKTGIAVRAPLHGSAHAVAIA